MTQPLNPEVAILGAALELGAADRAAYLDRACAGDAALRKQVEALLHAHEHAQGFLEAPPTGIDFKRTVRVDIPLTEKPGDRIGRYKLLQQIGEGGCGVVYMAEQEEPVRRRVALKVIKLGMDTKQVIARFEAERQALALMDHPNIAKVLDAGATETGRPYFVMELVRGIKITDFCDESKLSTEDRLKLFIQVCQAIQHAHQKGIIHRDIKPSNILVTINDGVPVPKVIDFGIAKATQGRLTDHTLFTAFEQFIGTPAYMSPEQAVMTSLDIDTRSDIYSLGVLLYELLTGRTPFDAKELLAAGLDEMRRTIRETEPPKPSTRLGTMLDAERTTTANHHHTDAPKLIHLLHGDLDWIVMKSLEKDRARRYETANGLAMDIERHLHDEPVNARPPSALYRLHKSVRRNKTAYAAATAIAAVLVIGVVVSTWQAIRATRAEREQSRSRQIAQQAQADEARQRREAVEARTRAEADEKKAETEAAKSQQVAQFLKQMLRSAGPEVALGRDATLLREILDRTAEQVNQYLTNQPAVQAELLNVSGWVYWTIGESGKAEAAFRQALAIQRKVLGKNHPDLADTLFGLAQVLESEGEPEESETFYREFLEIRRKVYGNEHVVVADCLNNLADALVAQGKLAEAESFSREALAMKRKLLPNDDPGVATSLRDLGFVLFSEGRSAEAERLMREALATFRRALGDTHPAVAITLNALADVLIMEDKLAEAEVAEREALAIQRNLYKTEAPQLINALLGLNKVLRKEGKLGEAETLALEIQAMQKKLWDKEPPGVTSLPNLSRQMEDFARRGEWKEALADATKMVARWPSKQFNYHALAPLQVQVGDLDGYWKTCRQAVAQFRGAEDPITAERMAKDCLILPDSGADLSAVGAWADTAVRAGKDSSDLPWFQLCKGLAEYRQGNFAGAVDWTQKVLSHASHDHERDVQAYMVLAMAQHGSKQAQEARAVLAKGVELAENKLPKLDSGDLGNWIDWIIAHALMREAKSLIEGQPANATEKKSEPH